MARTIEPHKVRRTDEFGDAWAFEYDPDNGKSIVTGSDVDWKPYLVLRGFASDLELSDEDILWLWRSWREAIELHGDPGIYGEELPGCTSREGPAEGFCPLCLRYQTEFEGHHVVWRMDKGSDHRKNLLPLCKSCHALTSHGGYEDRERRDRAAYYHQAARFGAAFFYNASTNKQSTERKIFRARWPERKDQLRPVRLKQGRMLRNWHESRYVYWRDTALERLPRFDSLTFDAYEGNFKQFERDRAEYVRKWESSRRSA